LSGQPIPQGTLWVNGVPRGFGGAGVHYQEIDIPDSGPFTIEISTISSASLQILLGNR
jgi:hypothetical protein